MLAMNEHVCAMISVVGVLAGFVAGMFMGSKLR
jgi:hypothetical protein